LGTGQFFNVLHALMLMCISKVFLAETAITVTVAILALVTQHISVCIASPKDAKVSSLGAYGGGFRVI
jgi:hypothetical protein